MQQQYTHDLPLQNRRGFTLIEVLLSIAFFGIIAGISYPVYQASQTRNDAVIAANTLEQSVRRAQLLARSGQYDSAWGVDIRSGSITLFAGNSYEMRDTDHDEVYTIPSGVAASEAVEMIFARNTGTTSSDQTVTFSTVEGATITMSVNTMGVVERQ